MTRNHNFFAGFTGVSFLALLIYFAVFFLDSGKSRTRYYGNELSSHLQKRSREIMEVVAGALQTTETASRRSEQINFWTIDYFQQSVGQNYLLFVIEDDSLVFWNNTIFSFFNVDSLNKDEGIVYNDQGLSLYASGRFGNYRIVAVDPVYLFYPIKNRYIGSGFTPEYGKFKDKIQIINKITAKTEHSHIVHNGRTIYIDDEYLEEGEAKSKTAKADIIISLLLLLFYATFRYFPNKNFFRRGSGIRKFLFPALFLILYLATINFSAWKISGEYTKSQGETLSLLTLIDAFLLSSSLAYLIIIFQVIDFLKSKAFRLLHAHVQWLALMLLMLSLPLAVELVFDQFLQQSALSDMVLMSKLSDFSSLVKLAGVLILASSTVYLIGELLKSIRKFGQTVKFAYAAAILPLLLLVLIWIFGHKLIIIYLFLSPAILLSTFGVDRVKLVQSESAGIIMAWLAVSFSFALLYSHSDRRLADEEQMLTARKLSSDKDPLLEFLFTDLSTKWKNDSVLIGMIFVEHADDQKINEYLRKNYLDGYLGRYETEVTTCYPEQDLILQPENRKVNCIGYFNSLTSVRGDSLRPGGLFLVDNNLLGVHYVGYIIVADSSSKQSDSLHLFIEFFHKYIPEGTGYPDLLIDASKSLGPDLNKYSFATYRDGTLYYKFGTYFFPLRLDQISADAEGFFNRDGYRHLVLKYSDKILIISRKEKEWAELMAPFSFFFLINGLIVIIISLLKKGLPDFRKLFSTFKTRLQLIISISLLASFILIGTITTVYLTDIYRRKNDDFLAEKTQSLIVELEHKLKDLPMAGRQMSEYLNQILLKFSLVFFTDINLYDVDGRLLATSRPEIFQLGLTGEMMHPGAYGAMRFQNRLYMRQYEEIGKARFISSYAPFKNSYGEIIAYINLPYFVKETEMQREVRSVVLSYLNIFLLLSVLSLVFALFISQRLTRPLQMIQQKMSRLQLGHANEKINYQGYDEIGALVNQYNTLLDQLAESAELLARSERESAWREMARQVAHEIKNPLTPMRLSVQYLLRAWDDNDPDIDQKLRNISQTLISQIDTLSSIASAFSDFAVMPQPRPVLLDLAEALQKVISLFDHHANISLIFNNNTHSPAWINADPEHINRIFTNLVKNSIQAIGAKPEAKIVVKLSELENTYLVEVEDTGKGMTEEEARKVFTPNFTTKSSGMGMGLSIVYNLVQQSGGNISFETRPGVGTTFTVELPKAAEKA